MGKPRVDPYRKSIKDENWTSEETKLKTISYLLGRMEKYSDHVDSLLQRHELASEGAII